MAEAAAVVVRMNLLHFENHELVVHFLHPVNWIEVIDHLLNVGVDLVHLLHLL